MPKQFVMKLTKSYSKTFNNLFLAMAVLYLNSCASKLLIQSEPPQADIFVTVEGRSEAVKLGTTPLEITELQLQESLKLSADNANWIELTLSKKDFEKRIFWLPSNRWGELSKNLKAQLKPLDDTSTTVTKMIKLLFNAKKFAETKQFEAAHSEIDKVLQIDSQMVSAIVMKAGIFFIQGNLAESKALYKKALEIDPGSNESIQMLEKIQNKSGGGQ